MGHRPREARAALDNGRADPSAWQPSPTHHRLRERLAVTRVAQISRSATLWAMRSNQLSSEGDKMVDAATYLLVLLSSAGDGVKLVRRSYVR